MPKRKIEFANGEIYHVTIRGVEKRKIFMTDQDYWRGIFSLYEFNDEAPVVIREKRKMRNQKLARDPASGKFPEKDNRERFVDIMAFVFMPNHIHMLLRQEKERGISRFLQKFDTGYARYFNDKYKRVGPLFQGRFNAARIEDDEYLKTVFVYIHTNPISVIDPGWKENGIGDAKKSKEFLEEYRWSSYLDYLEWDNFPSITQRDFLRGIFKNKEEMRNFVDSWIGYKLSLKSARGPASGRF